MYLYVHVENRKIWQISIYKMPIQHHMTACRFVTFEIYKYTKYISMNSDIHKNFQVDCLKQFVEFLTFKKPSTCITIA